MTRWMLVAPMALLVACADRSESAADTTAAPAAADATPPAGATTAAAGTVTGSGMTDPNAATREQLVAAGADTVAVRILMAGRPFADMVAVDKALAATHTAEQRKALYARVWKPIDLNSAKGEEILLIPGVGNRMKHEFEEYRPYTSIEQFRREMGKYVSKDEVARLEQYVMIR